MELVAQCQDCGKTFLRRAGRGRPRKFCNECIADTGHRYARYQDCESCGVRYRTQHDGNLCMACRPHDVARDGPKLCIRCGAVEIPNHRWYCDPCREAVLIARRGRPRRKQRRKPHTLPTAVRGYGAEHRRLRKEWAARVVTGRVACARCGLPILPGVPWDLGHDDFDRRRYNGPEHASCNRRTAGKRKRALVRAGRQLVEIQGAAW